MIELLLLSLFSLAVAQPQFAISCSEEGIATCDGLQRTCLAVNQEETCGPCKDGYGRSDFPEVNIFILCKLLNGADLYVSFQTVEFPEDVINNIADSVTTEEELKRLFTCFDIEKLTTALFVSRF